jgi:hypothetical protein
MYSFYKLLIHLISNGGDPVSSYQGFHLSGCFLSVNFQKSRWKKAFPALLH